MNFDKEGSLRRGSSVLNSINWAPKIKGSPHAWFLRLYTSHLLFVDYSPVSGTPGEQCHADPLGVRVLLVDAQPCQQVLAEGLHEAGAIATRQQVGVVVETMPHPSKEGKHCITETHL